MMDSGERENNERTDPFMTFGSKSYDICKLRKEAFPVLLVSRSIDVDSSIWVRGLDVG